MSNTDLIAASESAAAMTTFQSIAPYVTLFSALLGLWTAILGWLRSRDEREKARLQAVAQLALPPARRSPAKKQSAKRKPAKKKPAKTPRR